LATVKKKFSSRGEDFLTVANQKKELLLVAMFFDQMEPYGEALESILNRWPPRAVLVSDWLMI
jgi:hypothetical protein